MNILGISAFYHDSAACLIRDGEIVAAAQEERFTRKKHDERIPRHAIASCLEAGGVRPGEIDLLVFYEKPLTKFFRILRTHLACAPRSWPLFHQAVPVWMNQKLWIPYLLEKTCRDLGYGSPRRISFAEHHESHAASAFFPSPFEKSAILTMDGVGEWATTTIGRGEGNSMRLLAEIRFPHSLGLLYSAFTYFTGFRVNSGEYKLMGLAPYGEPVYVDRIREHLVDIHPDGSFQLDMSYFDYLGGLTMTNDRFGRLFGGPPRCPESEISQREVDLARSVQVVVEEVVLRMAQNAMERAGSRNLCLAGGVALNCVANGRILREAGVENLWIQPASGDAGGALGAALYAWYQHLGNPRLASGPGDRMGGAQLGPKYSDDEIGAFLIGEEIPHQELGDEEWSTAVAGHLAEQNIVGLFQGRMEFGPRALGNRSILGDPRSPKMQSVMNLKIKYRESFRPFAPSVLRERVQDYFELDEASPYMLLVAPVHPDQRLADGESEQGLAMLEKLYRNRSRVPAVTHVDYSARVQTVDPEQSPRYYQLIKAFESLTGCPLVVNTSFNVRGEPLVCTPQDAFACFMRTEMDVLVLGSYLIRKEDMAPIEGDDRWQEEFPLD